MPSPVPNMLRTWQTFIVKIGCVCILLSLVAVAAVSMIARPRIHSCELYIPNKFSNFIAAIQSIGEYGLNQGWHALLSDVTSIIRSEILDLAPYPEIRPKLMYKHLLMIGGAKTPLAFRRARQLGVSLTVVDDSRMAAFVAGHAKQFIGIDDFGRAGVKNPESVLEAVRGQCLVGTAESKDKQSVFDGIFTLVEDHGPLTSFLAERLNLVASSSQSARLARNKFLMRQAMKAAGLQVPRFAQVASEADLDAAAAAVGFPAFLKPVYGVQVRRLTASIHVVSRVAKAPLSGGDGRPHLRRGWTLRRSCRQHFADSRRASTQRSTRFTTRVPRWCSNRSLAGPSTSWS